MKKGEVQKLLDDFRDKVIAEAKQGLPRDTGGLAKSLKSYVKASKNSIQLTFQMKEYGWFQDRGVKGVSSGESLSNYRFGTGNGEDGDPNTGGGGGGAYGNSLQNGGSGGSGVCILKIPTVYYSGTYTGASVVETTVGDYTILQFNDSGSYTA